MAQIELDHVSKVYGGITRAVNALTLDVPDGEFMVFVGPSGCGKSTALRMVAGLEDITEGEIRIGDRVVNDMPPKDRDIAMVFQNYALYPHMTVEDNLAFGLQLRKTPKEEQRKRVAEAAKMLALEPFLKRKPAALSGGQRQRVAMGRAIVRNPQAYLMDEPLSNLDAKLRVSMRAQLSALHERLGVTTIYVTHDQVEAMTLGSRVAVLKDGELMQVDTPQSLFDAPSNLFVATFIGSPAMNLVKAKLIRDGGPAVVFADYKIAIPQSAVHDRPSLDHYFGRDVIIGIRPSSLEDANFASSEWPRIKADVAVVEELGSEINVIFTLHAPQVHHEIMIAKFDRAAKDEVEAEELAGEGQSLWTATVNPKSSARPGRPIDLAIDVTLLQFFDPGSGEAIPLAPRPQLEAPSPPGRQASGEKTKWNAARVDYEINGQPGTHLKWAPGERAKVEHYRSFRLASWTTRLSALSALKMFKDYARAKDEFLVNTFDSSLVLDPSAALPKELLSASHLIRLVRLESKNETLVWEIPFTGQQIRYPTNPVEGERLADEGEVPVFAVMASSLSIATVRQLLTLTATEQVKVGIQEVLAELQG
jgi:multiple sugar transport system ATP-binding protein